MKFSDRVARVRKAIAAVVVPVVVGLCVKYGIDVDVEVVEIVVMAILTGASVYAIPNDGDGIQ